MQLLQLLEAKESRELHTIGAKATVLETARALCRHRIGALPVLADDGKLVGIITERDILQECCRDCDDIGEKPVASVMTRQVITAHVHDDMHDTLRVLAGKHIRHLPVLDEEGKLVGVVSIGDILRSLYEEDELKLLRMSDYLGGTYSNQVF